MTSLPGLRNAVKSSLAPLAASVADQAFFGGGSFILNVIVARRASVPEYGHFSVLLAGLFGLTVLHSALLVEPLIVLSPSEDTAAKNRYAASVLSLHLLFLLFLLLLSTVCHVGNTMLSITQFGDFLSLGLASAGFLTHGLARAFCIVERKQPLIALASAFYCSLVALLALFRPEQPLAASTYFLLAGASAVVPAIVLLAALRIFHGLREVGRLLPSVAKNHYSYGRWALGSGVATWMVWSAPYPIMSHFGYISGAARLRSLMNLLMPFVQVISATTLLSIPGLASHRQSDLFSCLRNRIVGLALVGGLLYATALGGLASPLAEWLYAHRYPPTPTERLMLSVLAVATTLSTTMACVLRARIQPTFIFFSYCAGAALSFASLSLISFGQSATKSLITMTASTLLTAVLLIVWEWRLSASNSPNRVSALAGARGESC